MSITITGKCFFWGGEGYVANFAEKRLKPDDRRKAILKAAADVFLEKGYYAASIDEIIERAGGSKRSIYSEFGNKEGLFIAIVNENSQQIMGIISRAIVEGKDLRTTLFETARYSLEILTSPLVIGLYRAMIGDAWRFPQLAKTYYESGPGFATSGLVKLLEAAKQRGEVDVEDCAAVADHFYGMIRDNLFHRVVLGLRKSPKAAEREKLAASIVDLFLKGVLVRRK